MLPFTCIKKDLRYWEKKHIMGQNFYEAVYDGYTVTVTVNTPHNGFSLANGYICVYLANDTHHGAFSLSLDYFMNMSFIEFNERANATIYYGMEENSDVQ